MGVSPSESRLTAASPVKFWGSVEYTLNLRDANCS